MSVRTYSYSILVLIDAKDAAAARAAQAELHKAIENHIICTPRVVVGNRGWSQVGMTFGERDDWTLEEIREGSIDDDD